VQRVAVSYLGGRKKGERPRARGWGGGSCAQTFVGGQLSGSEALYLHLSHFIEFDIILAGFYYMTVLLIALFGSLFYSIHSWLCALLHNANLRSLVTIS